MIDVTLVEMESTVWVKVDVIAEDASDRAFLAYIFRVVPREHLPRAVTVLTKCSFPLLSLAPPQQQWILRHGGVPDEVVALARRASSPVACRLETSATGGAHADATAPGEPTTAFAGALKPYQQRAMRFITERRRSMAALDMGLGKTVIGVAYATRFLPALLVVPAGVRTSWIEHCATFAPSVPLFSNDYVAIDVETLRPGTKRRRRRADAMTAARPVDVLPTNSIVLCTYAKLGTFSGRSTDPVFGCIVADEAHYLKHATSKRSKTFRLLQRTIERTLLLTGTPAQKHMDLFHLLHLLDPVAFPRFYHYRPERTLDQQTRGGTQEGTPGNKRKRAADTAPRKHALSKARASLSQQQMVLGPTIARGARAESPAELPAESPAELLSPDTAPDATKFYFASRYCVPETVWKFGRDVGFKFNKNQRDQELSWICKLYIIRMLKDDVVVLPSASRSRVDVHRATPAEQQRYQASMGEVEHLRETKGSLYADAALLALCRDTALDKLPHVFSYLLSRGILENAHPKCILFFYHRAVGHAITEWLTSHGQSFVYIDGGVSHKERNRRIDEWKHGTECRLGVLSLCAASTGLNLQFCTRIYCVELTFLSTHHTQSEARIHRIGQSQSVDILYLCLAGSTDDMLWSSLSNRIRTESLIFDSRDKRRGGHGAPRNGSNRRGADSQHGESEEIIVPL